MTSAPTEIFLATLPGLETILADEARELGFSSVNETSGGVTVAGGWSDVWRANLHLRCASRVLARIGGFRAMHPAQLDKRARKFDWAACLRPDVALRVEASCHRSKIYHAGAASSRVERAITETLGAPIAKDADLRLLVRIEDDLCTFSLDTSGAPLHQRGHKQAVGKAPLRETMAAAFLRSVGFRGDEPLVDPMCGSGTFTIEAAEIASGLPPGRSRSFAFETLPSFDAAQWQTLKSVAQMRSTDFSCFGSDRDAGAVASARANAERAGVSQSCTFDQRAISNLLRPEGPTGLIMVNPPYGARIGNKRALYGLYGALGKKLMGLFSGWRVGLVTSDDGLARATGLPWQATGPFVPHGGIKVRLWQTAALP
ncbi:MAG: class I SAM-dependent RNA methyltransferase [Pseudomonadota bacterium]